MYIEATSPQSRRFCPRVDGLCVFIVNQITVVWTLQQGEIWRNPSDQHGAMWSGGTPGFRMFFFVADAKDTELLARKWEQVRMRYNSC